MKSAKLIVTALATASSSNVFGWDDFSVQDSLALLQMRSQVIKKTDRELGPDDWASVSPECAGTLQSPIDIPVDASDAFNGGLEFSYGPVDASNLAITNTGNGLQVNGLFGEMTLPDGQYEVKQFHFHCPSEHSENGKLASCEMRIVHQKKGSAGTDDLAIVAILFDPIKETGLNQASGLELAFLRRLGLGHRLELPYEGKSKPIANVPVDLGTTFGKVLSGGYYHYQGSLTTPPCSETVHWYVMQTHAAISEKMIENVNILFPDAANNRPVQPLNDRTVVAGEEAIAGEFEQTDGLEVHWTYGEQQKWSDSFPACAGISQSPVNLNGLPKSNTGAVLNKHTKYHQSKGAGLMVKNNGHGIEVDINGKIGYLDLPDGRYTALRLSFHFPSEHSVDGKLAAGEMHIVHQKEGSTGTDDLAVVSILIDDVKTLGYSFSTGIEVAFFRDLGFGAKSKLPLKGQEQPVTLDDIDIAASFATQLAGPFWHYSGSLTAPPCSESVHWYVLQKRAAMTTKMVSQFKQLYPNPANSRIVHPLYDRAVSMDMSVAGEFFS